MSHHKMQGQRRSTPTSKHTVCRTFCCTSCRISVSSTVEEGDNSRRTNHSRTISSLAHYLVQERLDQMIKQSEEEQARRVMEARKRKQKIVDDSSRVNSSSSSSRRRLLFVVAMEKCSNDPRQDFRRSMIEVILANKLKEVKDLRCLLKYYISVNSEEYKGVILEAFYQVCNDVFFSSCKCH